MCMRTLLLACAALIASATPAMAQDDNDLRVRAGLGGQLKPEFPGADDHRLAPLFDLDFARGSNPFPFEAPDDAFGVRLLSKGGFAAGPAANFQGKRKESDVGAPVGKVKATVEIGGFAEYHASKSIRLRADLRQGVNGHEGLVGSLGVDRIWRDGDRYVFSIGPRVLFSDAKFQRAYFGVDNAASLASGLPAYRPDGGIYAVAAASGLSYQFNSRFGAFGFARYERLVGDAGKSPIVRDLGSRDQLSGGVGLSYSFFVKR